MDEEEGGGEGELLVIMINYRGKEKYLQKVIMQNWDSALLEKLILLVLPFL